MHFKYIKYISFVLLSVWIVGCGSLGGGESSDDTLLDDNRPPVAYNQEFSVSNSVVNQDSRLHILLEAHDADGDKLSYHIIQKPKHGRLEGEVPMLYYIPDSGYVGQDQFVFEVYDGYSYDRGVIKIDILKVNRPPEAIDDNLSVEEQKAIAIDVLNNDTDIDTNSSFLHIVSVTQPHAGKVSFDKKHIYYVSDDSIETQDVFGYVMADEYNATSRANVYINIIRDNHSPVAYSQDVTVVEDTSVSIELNASDIDGDVLSYHLAYSRYIPSHGVVSGIAPHLVYTPEHNFNGDDYISFYVDDGNQTSQVAVVNIKVVPVNDAPIANAGDDKQGVTGDSFVLDGSKSYDIDGEIVSYEWIESNQTISTQPIFSKLFTTEGVHRISLRVTDDKNATGMDEVVVDISLCNQGCIHPDPTQTVPFQ